LGSLTSLFRYYSCIFRISSGKATTSRAILNRKIDIPFTYTMESSNGFYYDAATKAEMPFSWKKYKEMGVYLCKALGLLGFDQQNRIRRGTVKDIVKDGYREDS
jgi:cytosolic carboxypeptidase protein 2/3